MIDSYFSSLMLQERKEGCRCGGLTYRRKDGLCVLREDCRENKF